MERTRLCAAPAAVVGGILRLRKRKPAWPKYLAEPLEQRLQLAVTGTLPVLLIYVEGGPGIEQHMNSDHDLAYFQQIFYGAPGSMMEMASSINYSDTPGGTQGHFASDSAFPDHNGEQTSVTPAGTASGI